MRNIFIRFVTKHPSVHRIPFSPRDMKKNIQFFLRQRSPYYPSVHPITLTDWNTLIFFNKRLALFPQNGYTAPVTSEKCIQAPQLTTGAFFIAAKNAGNAKNAKYFLMLYPPFFQWILFVIVKSSRWALKNDGTDENFNKVKRYKH